MKKHTFLKYIRSGILIPGLVLCTGHASARNYTWNLTAGSGDAAIASNWTPARNIPDATDTLYFGNGGSSVITNYPSGAVEEIVVFNNTGITFKLTLVATITIGGNIRVKPGSNADLSDSVGVAFAGGGTPATATIEGTLSISGAGASFYDAANSVTTVTGTGVIQVRNNGSITGTPGTLVFNSGARYHHDRDGGAIPAAAYDPASVIYVSGITANPLAPAAKMGSVIWDCPGQTVVNSWNSSVDSVYGNLTIRNTGTGRIESGPNPAMQVMGDFIQAGGTFAVGNHTSGSGQVNVSGRTDLIAGTLLLNASTSGGASYTFRTCGNFRQEAAHTISRLNTSPASFSTVSFSGNTPDTVALSGIVSGNISFTLNNPAGAVLAGTVPINANAAHTITSGTWAGTGSLIYNDTASVLVYDGAGAQTADTLAFPSSNGPASVTINKASGTAVTFPFNRTIPGTLTLTGGDIDLGANNLTIGTSAANTGSIAGTGGMIRITTGTLTRWFGTGDLPVAAGTGAGYYPIGAATFNRNVFIYFNDASALVTGGTITVSHHHASTNTSGLNIPDGTYTINTRTDAAWSFTTGAGMGLGTGNSIGLSAVAGNLLVPANAANLRLMHASSVAGTHVAGSGTSPDFVASRTGLSLADLTASPFHAGISNSDMLLSIAGDGAGQRAVPGAEEGSSAPVITGVDLMNAGSNTVRAYPNPVSGHLTVEVNGKTGAGACILLADLTGRIIRQAEVRDNLTKIDMSALARGVYFIRYADGSQSRTIKINKD